MPSRVLIVEDNVVARRIMQHHLKSLDLNCYAVTTGEEAVVLAEYFDLILMDLQLPGISGVEATRLIRRNETAKKLPPVPIVATTSIAYSTECFTAGMNDHYCKPISRYDLAQILEDWLDGRSQRWRELG